jgi:hypothetical protein
MKRSLISLGRGLMARLDPVQPFLPPLTNIANYAAQKNTQPQHALNLRTKGQNVPSAEVGTRLTIVV